MKIGFAGNGHLMAHSKAAAFKKGCETISYTPGKTDDHPSDLFQCDIVYVCPDRPSNTSPKQMVDLILPHLNPDSVLVVLCQVEPGFTRTIDWPKERLYYQVETLRMKDAAHRALKPERIIIGTEYKKSWSFLFLKFIQHFTNHIIIMSYEEAELAKIAINVYLAAQVVVTDTLANVAKEVGADWNYIIPALTSDKRIGKEAYINPGGYCGEHLERDLRQINKYGADTSVTETLLKYSETIWNTTK